jgi:hypothetical protein
MLLCWYRLSNCHAETPCIHTRSSRCNQDYLESVPAKIILFWWVPGYKGLLSNAATDGDDEAAAFQGNTISEWALVSYDCTFLMHTVFSSWQVNS